MVRVIRKVLINSVLLTLNACTLPSNIPANFGISSKIPVTLLSIAVTPSSSSVSLGVSEQFTATGTYSDNSTQDLTSSCLWSHVNVTGSASISNSGLASTIGGGIGTVTITATLNGVSGSTTLNISTPVLVSIAVTPANASVPLGNTEQFTATGTYTDSSTQDLTSSVTWSETNGTGSASVNNSGLGATLGGSQGTATIVATMETISGNTTLNIGAPILVSIAVTPATPSVPIGNTQQFTATGTYSDTSTSNITSSVTWSKSNGTGSTSLNGTGLAATLGGAQGTVTITATLGIITGNATLTVSAPALVSIAVTPATPSVLIGNIQQFTATGTYTDTSTQNLTSSVTWSETNGTGTAAINSSGLANTSAGGTVTITATSGAISGNTTLTVTDYSITTVAGEFWPTTGIGGPATSALLYNPTAVAFDTSGNVYIADAINNVIRKVSVSTGHVSNFAGTGNLGYSGDGGAASNATLNGPTGVALDSSGNVYIADSENNVIRRVSAITGDISTFAGSAGQGNTGDGGPATSATLFGPVSIAFDGSGDLFIADSQNRVVREVSATSGNISTAAGNGNAFYNGDGQPATSASIFLPAGLASDSSGNLYIADMNNHLIRKVTAATGYISTIAGVPGHHGYNGDGGAATSAWLNNPQAVVLDSSGNLYIADSNNNRIREVAASNGHISTITGNGTAGYSGDGGPATSGEIQYPEGVALDSSGNVFISDTFNDRIRLVSASTGDLSTFGGGTSGFSGDGGLATQAELNFPTAIALDSSGNFYIGDSNNYRVRKVTVSTGDIATVAGNGTSSYGGDGGLATSAALTSADGLAIDASGNIYIADTLNSRIRMVASSNGRISTIAGNGTAGYSGDGGAATSGEIQYPQGIVLDASGNIYIADTQNNRIRVVSAANGHISTIAGNGTGGYSGDGGLATSGQLNTPQGVALDSSGNIFIADTSNNIIREVSALTGKISTVAGNGTPGYTGDGGLATSAQLNQPYSVAIDTNGNLYIVDGNNSVIRKVIAATGDIETVAGNGNPAYGGDGGSAANASLKQPSGIAIDNSGNIYVADTQNNLIRKVTP